MKKFLIADDHHLILNGLKQAIQSKYKGAIVHTAINKKELDYYLENDSFELLILDVKFGEDNALHFIDQLRKTYPQLKIFILSSVADQYSVQKLVNAGIQGYVVKSESIVDILNGIHHIVSGQTYFSRQIQNKLTSEKSESIVLTRREHEVLTVILKEKSIKEIAAELNISTKTVEMHRSNLFSKLGVKNVAGLVKKALLLGLVTEDHL